MNSFFVMGNAGKDAETRMTKTEKKVTNFSLAVYAGTNKQTGEVNPPDWFKIVAFDSDIAETITKGDRVLVVGKLKNTCWEKDGVKHTGVEVWANTVAKITRPIKTMVKQDMANEFELMGNAAEDSNIPF